MHTTVAGPTFRESALGPAAGACSVAVAGGIVASFISMGTLSGHMATHIFLMNIAAPLVAIAMLGWRATRSIRGPSALWLATGAQLAVLWFSHSPILHHVMQAHFLVAVAVHVALFMSALVFWVAIVNSVRWRWHAIFALLVSGKLACLLGALLVFSPRLIYGAHGGAHGPAVSGVAAIADQHLAGLLMIVACPLSFVLTAIVLTAQALREVSASNTAPPPGIFPVGH